MGSCHRFLSNGRPVRYIIARQVISSFEHQNSPKIDIYDLLIPQLKKLINSVVSELSLLGLDPTVLHQLLQQERERFLIESGAPASPHDEDGPLNRTIEESIASGSGHQSSSQILYPSNSSFASLGRFVVPGTATPQTPTHAVYELISEGTLFVENWLHFTSFADYK